VPARPLADERVTTLPWALARLLGSTRLAKLLLGEIRLEPTIIIVVSVGMHLTSALPLAAALGATLPMFPFTPMAYFDAIFADLAGFIVARLDLLEITRAMAASPLPT